VGAIPAAPATQTASASRARALDLAGIGILAALHVGGDTAMYLWAPSLLAALPGPAPLPPAWVLSGIAVAYLVGRVAMAAAPEGLWERRLLVLPGMGATALLAIALGGSCGFAATFALLVAASSCYGLEYPALVGVLARRDPSAFPAALSACNLGGAIGGALMTSQVGLANASVGVASALLIAPACFFAFSLLAWRLTRSGVAVPA
jgi:fucose permease